jgi:hypothetical protein
VELTANAWLMARTARDAIKGFIIGLRMFSMY